MQNTTRGTHRDTTTRNTTKDAIKDQAIESSCVRVKTAVKDLRGNIGTSRDRGQGSVVIVGDVRHSTF
jgi:hypothetical protein